MLMYNILITGMTGFLGTEIVSGIMRTTEDNVYGIVRASSLKEASVRLENLWYRRPELRDNIGKRIIPVIGDITKEDLNLADADRELLIRNTDYIIHTAALIGIRHTKEEFWDANVTGTENVLSFAELIQEDHPLKRFSHISTAYVAGTGSGRIMEDSLENSGFSSLYEESKYEGELRVREASDKFPVSVFRPGEIVGDSVTGYVKNFNTLYYPLKLYLRGEMSVFPIKKSMRVNMVPVDYVANSVIKITYDDTAAGKTFHLTAPTSLQPTVGELIDAVRDWAKENISLDLKKPVFLPGRLLARFGTAYNMSYQDSSEKSVSTNMLALSPYFSDDKEFDTTNTERYVSADFPDWHEYLPNLLKYAVDKNFLSDNSRTVFEQVRFCLRRKNSPVTYYDVTDDRIIEYSASSVEEMTESALKSLQALGVGPGSRVAISGINSVSYFALDVAIGLSGAASVPLYYTTPAGELDELLAKSSAGWFFIGDRRILAHADQLKYEGKMISFTENAPLPEGVMSWKDFTSLGEGRKVSPVSVSYSDIATIRYTSGTTGNSKSVAFTHYQLRWMAETMGSLLSFKSRSKKAVYLSFLPLSHVVEGILGAYAPYYLGSTVSLYFLNNFDKAAESLPKVRPTIFFSVPRFYEKVWNELAANSVGKLYISTENDSLKKILRPVLKSTILKRAGLDRCDQLIVGSAPVSLKLLTDFRELGIEIHNAYGLTEAPLITLNRLGKNDLTTVGEPLPETEVTIADDGEILVKGPQVAAEYDGRDSDILHTGDLGELTEDGYLRIVGRKKEILINSYGKNINMQRVETLLGDIPGISEALIIGEKRPYCVALLWPEEDEPAPDEETLKEAVLAVNEELNHPEQVKRYAVMSSPLKIATGELTPNLKLRRNNIEEIHQDTIEGLYAPEAVPAGSVLYIGAL